MPRERTLAGRWVDEEPEERLKLENPVERLWGPCLAEKYDPASEGECSQLLPTARCQNFLSFPQHSLPLPNSRRTQFPTISFQYRAKVSVRPWPMFGRLGIIHSRL